MIDDVIACAVPDSGPGVPLAALGGTNEEVVSAYSALVKEALLERLHLLCDAPVVYKPVVEMSSLDLVDACMVDPVRVFIKKEPHKLAKLVEGRYRSIASVSLEDSLLERVLYQKSAKFEIARWKEIPSKPGMGSSDEDIEALAYQILAMQGKHSLAGRVPRILDTDVKGWDWQVKRWMMICLIFIEMILMGVRPGTQQFRAISNREIAAAKPCLCDTNGKLWELSKDALWLSGRFITSKGNSKMRTLLSVLVGTENIAMGDDCNEVVLPDRLETEVLETYSSMGYTPKLMETKANDDLEGTIFCSMRFYKRESGVYTAEPVNWVRTLYRLLSKKYTRAEFEQFRFEVRNSREVSPELLELLERGCSSIVA